MKLIKLERSPGRKDNGQYITNQISLRNFINSGAKSSNIISHNISSVQFARYCDDVFCHDHDTYYRHDDHYQPLPTRHFIPSGNKNEQTQIRELSLNQTKTNQSYCNSHTMML